MENSPNWAVITGASSGLGSLFAKRLAADGMSLLLTGRDRERLDAVRDEVHDLAPEVEVQLLVADLASEDGLVELLALLDGRAIDVLVNNAGFGTYGRFGEVEASREAAVIAVDVAAVVRLTHAVLPGMISRGRGRILNVASTIAFQPAPYQAVYGAAKAFVLSFSQALWAETRNSGVTVTALCPGPTRTGFVGALEADVSETAIYRRLSEPGPVVEAGLRALERGHPVAVPGLRNRIMFVAARATPPRLLTRIMERMLAPPTPQQGSRTRTP
jgi:short-subunit dehydrogenase